MISGGGPPEFAFERGNVGIVDVAVGSLGEGRSLPLPGRDLPIVCEEIASRELVKRAIRGRCHPTGCPAVASRSIEPVDLSQNIENMARPERLELPTY